MENIEWYDAIRYKPNIGEPVLVRTISGQIYYAVYSNHDEFDIHIMENFDNYRNTWYKFSSKTVVEWSSVLFKV